MTKTVSEFIWLAGILVWFVIRYPFSRRSRRISVAASQVDWREWLILSFAGVGLFLLPLLYVVFGEPRRLDRPFSPIAAWIGTLVLCGAILLFWRSHADLGRNWSATLKIRVEHRLVTSGVYRLIRHPMYSSFILLGIAQLLLLPNWLAGMAGFAGAVTLFACRYRREERMMLERFEPEYRNLMLRTKRIIPWVF
jgi:protein-S-isoprenylcysteine O-methyltransferase Ste14